MCLIPGWLRIGGKIWTESWESREVVVQKCWPKKNEAAGDGEGKRREENGRKLTIITIMSNPTTLGVKETRRKLISR